MKNKNEIVVIGAGLAGLTAAYRLNQKGYNVTIYEATGRIGGRIFTVQMKNVDSRYINVELGGHNINDGGIAKNILTLAKELECKVYDDVVKFENGYVFHDNQYFKLTDLISESFKDSNEVDLMIDKLALRYTSMNELIDQLLPDNEPLRMSVKTGMMCYEGVDIYKQSVYHNIDTLKNILKPGFIPGQLKERVFKVIKAGNAQIPLKIAEKIGEKIKLNKVLKEISKDNDKIILNFNKDEKESCDQLILAIPSAVYKDIKIDNNLIPQYIIEKINKIEYGQNSKLMFPIKKDSIGAYLITENQFTGLSNNQEVGLLYFAKSLMNPLQELIIAAKCFKSWDIPITEPKIIKGTEQQYEKFDEPVTYSWINNPYACGSYSGYSICNSTEYDEKSIYKGVEFKTTFRPINNQVFFIGEHATNLLEIGTMEAAVQSAENLMKLF